MNDDDLEDIDIKWNYQLENILSGFNAKVSISAVTIVCIHAKFCKAILIDMLQTSNYTGHPKQTLSL